MVLPPTPIFMDRDVLDKMQDEGEFASLVIDDFEVMCAKARLKPTFSPSLMHDAWESFRWDTKRLDGNMSSTPDHFKICGFAAYWLRRNSPVVDLLEAGEGEITGDEAEWRGLFGKYSRAFLAFYFGYRICYFIERNRKGIHARLSQPDMDYIESLCYVMKYKSLSPHAMGMIYRSLFFSHGGIFASESF